MMQYRMLAVCWVLWSALFVPRVEAASLELTPANAVLSVGDQIELLVYGTDFLDGADGGDFSLYWTPNLAFVGFVIDDPPFDLSSFDDAYADSGFLDAIDVFSIADTPGLGGGPFNVARLTLQATEEGAASVSIGTNLVGWSLAGGSLDYSIGLDAQIEIQGVPEPAVATALAFSVGWLGSLGRAQRRTRG
jgi:hypothetical protein